MILRPLLISMAGAGFCFILQAWPRLVNRYFGVDVWRHLLAADYIRKNKKLPVESLWAYLFKGKFDYPPLLIIIISWLPKKFIERFQGLVSPFIESLHSLLVFWACFFLTKNVTISLSAQIIMALIPVVVMENSQLSARGFGSFIFSVSFISMIFFTTFGGWLFLALAIVFTVILFVSHKMAAQAMFLNVILFSILDRDIFYVLICLVSFILTWLLFPRLYKRILVGQLAVLNFFKKNIKVRYAHQIRGITKRPQTDSDFVTKAKGLISKLPILALVTSNPFLLVGVIMYIIFVNNPNMSYLLPVPYQIFGKLLLWVVVMYILGILTAQVRLFQFLGEGTKYTLYAAWPLSIILAAFASYYFNELHQTWFIAILFLAGLVSLGLILFLQQKIIVKDKMRSLTPSLVKIIDYLKKYRGEVRLATFPLPTAEIVSYFANCKVLSTDSAYTNGFDEDYLNFNPVLRKPLRYFLIKYRINFVLINKDFITLEEMDLGRYKIAREEEDWILLRYSAQLRLGK